MKYLSLSMCCIPNKQAVFGVFLYLYQMSYIVFPGAFHEKRVFLAWIEIWQYGSERPKHKMLLKCSP